MINGVLVNILSAAGAAAGQSLSSVCPTKLDSNQFPQLQRLARKKKAVAQLNYQTYLVIYVS